MFEKQAHCVSVTRMLCNGKITADLLSSCDDCYYDAVCVDVAIQGDNEAFSSSQMLL